MMTSRFNPINLHSQWIRFLSHGRWFLIKIGRQNGFITGRPGHARYCKMHCFLLSLPWAQYNM